MSSSQHAAFERVEGALEALRRSIASYSKIKEPGDSDVDASLSDSDIDEMFEDVEASHTRLVDHPYSLWRRMRLTETYQGLGYPDLAAGEAYKMLLLIDEALDESGEYHEEALNSVKEFVIAQHGQERWVAAQIHCQTDLGLERYKDLEGPIDLDVEDAEAQLWAEHWFSRQA